MRYKVFSGKNIIITGAASGIGLELVRQLLPYNPNLLLVDIQEGMLSELAENKPQIKMILLADLSQKSGNQSILDWAKANWKEVHYCFANAGKAEYGPAKNQNWEGMDSLFQLNVYSPIQIGFQIRAAFPESDFQLLITASAMSFWAVPGYSLYGATKSALLQWANTIWSEKEGNWVSLAFPIATETRFFDSAKRKIPKPYPRQSAAVVAKRILIGAAKRKRKIFPSRLFSVLFILNRFLPFIRVLVEAIEFRRYKKWHVKQSEL